MAFLGRYPCVSSFFKEKVNICIWLYIFVLEFTFAVIVNYWMRLSKILSFGSCEQVMSNISDCADLYNLVYE